MGYFNDFDRVFVDGYQTPAGETQPTYFISVVSPDYLKTMQIPLVKGRDITAADTISSPFVAVINESMAKRYWPNQDPIGRYFRVGAEPKKTIEVVGVAGNSRFQGATGDIGPMFYLPLTQHYSGVSLQTLQVRTKTAPEEMIPEIEQVVGTLAPNLPVFDVRTMNEALNTLNGFLFFRIGAGVAGALGLLGLILAIVGVYGVVSYAASQRTREIGIRMAMGAQRFDVLRMIFSQGLLIVAIGLAVGIVCAFGAAQLARNFLVVSATDPLTYLSVSALLTCIALTACYIPALRAMRLNPTTALRHE
jgi:predicted permease